MNTNIKNAFRLGALAITGLFMAYSCSDKWDDHYAGNLEGVAFDGTIISGIEGQTEYEVSDFLDVLKATGYDRNLNSDQIYTVWAPVNGSFDKDGLFADLAAGDTAKVIDRFVKNHVALYNISLTPNEQTVTLLNSKSVKLTSAAEGKFGKSDVLQANIVCTNGILNIISNANEYVPTIFEQLEDDYKAYLSENPDVDAKSLISMMTFLKAYDADSLDESKSVYLGLDPNGNRVYVDSVMLRNNTILRSLDAYLYRDDSTYWAISPSVKAYQERYEIAKTFLNFNPSENVVNPNTTDSLQNRYANLFAMRDMFYNVNANEHYTDSLKSTEYSPRSWEDHVFRGNPYAEGGLFAKAEPVECSNGIVYRVNEYPMSIYDQFYRKISTKVSNSHVDNTEDTSGKMIYVKSCKYPLASYNNTLTYTSSETGYPVNVNYYYTEVLTTSSTSTPTVTFKVYNTLSGKYDVKLVTVPIRHKIGADKNDTRKYQFRATYFVRDDAGKYTARGVQMKDPVTDSRDFVTAHPEDVMDEEGNILSYDIAVYDTINLGEVDLEYSYYGRSDAGFMLQLNTKVGSKEKDLFSRDILVNSIIFEPKRETTTEPTE